MMNDWLFLKAGRPLVPQASSLLQSLLYQSVSCPQTKIPNSRYMVLSSRKDKINGRKEGHKFWVSEPNPVDFPYAYDLLIKMEIATA